MIPRVVIVGRPNVGKSTLFNALAGRRLSIEDQMAGVTRDRVSFVLGIGDKSVELVDTGGIGLVDETALAEEIDAQITLALLLADLVLFVVDAKDGVLPTDRMVADRLRKLDVPVMLVANKCEGRLAQSGVGESHALGFGEPHVVSAKERNGIADLKQAVVDAVGESAIEPQLPSDVVRLAILGRMNVGKSTLVNAVVGEDRVIVSEVPGTTRDAVDVPFVLHGRKFVAIDTAGIRKEKTVSDSVEFYSQARAMRALRRADVVLLLLDSTRDIGRIDRQIAGEIAERAVPAILVVSKWDLVEGRATIPTFEDYIRKQMPGLSWAPIAFMSGLTGQNIEPTLELAAQLHDQSGVRVSTGTLNRVLQRAMERRKPRVRSGRIGKVYFGSQVGTHPPTIALMVNDPSLFDDNWQRYLLHALQAELPYTDIPVRLEFQARSKGRRSPGTRAGRGRGRS